jgi:hypothetical protein
MSVSEIIILYFSIGMPFGVYFFLKNRFQKTSFLKSIAITFVWIPYAFRLFHKRINKKLLNNEFDNKLSLVSQHQKSLENILIRDNSGVLLFEFREVIERYIALTLNSKEIIPTFNENKREIFRITKNPNLELSSICLNRLNQQKLKHHQSNARKDFVNLLYLMTTNTSQKPTINSNLRSIAKDLDDFKLIEAFNEISRVENEKPQKLEAKSNIRLKSLVS